MMRSDGGVDRAEDADLEIVAVRLGLGGLQSLRQQSLRSRSGTWKSIGSHQHGALPRKGDPLQLSRDLMAEAEELRKKWYAALIEYETAKEQGRPAAPRSRSSTPLRNNSRARISPRQRRQSTRTLPNTR